MSELRGFTPSTYKSTTAEFTLGGIYEDPTTGYKYRYCKSTDSIAFVDGMIAEMAIGTTTTVAQSWIVTVDRAGGSSANRLPVGVVVCPLSTAEAAAGNYIFLLVEGGHSAIRDAANALTKGIRITTHATTDGDAAAQGAYTDKTVGWALAAASGGTCPARIKVEI